MYLLLLEGRHADAYAVRVEAEQYLYGFLLLVFHRQSVLGQELFHAEGVDGLSVGGTGEVEGHVAVIGETQGAERAFVGRRVVCRRGEGGLVGGAFVVRVAVEAAVARQVFQVQVYRTGAVGARTGKGDAVIEAFQAHFDVDVGTAEVANGLLVGPVVGHGKQRVAVVVRVVGVCRLSGVVLRCGKASVFPLAFARHRAAFKHVAPAHRLVVAGLEVVQPDALQALQVVAVHFVSLYQLLGVRIVNIQVDFGHLFAEYVRCAVLSVAYALRHRRGTFPAKAGKVSRRHPVGRGSMMIEM